MGKDYQKRPAARDGAAAMGDRMELVIRDNGQGFNLEEVSSPERARRGLGLTNMRERIELSGGSFAVESTEGKETIVRASWPLRGES